jgi:hypothetical protein
MNLVFLNSSISFPSDRLSLPALYVFIFTQYTHKVNEVYISFMKPGPYPRSLLFNYRILIKSALFVQEAWPVTVWLFTEIATGGAMKEFLVKENC